MTDLYAILGVAKTASKAAIKAAYRKLAKKLHPDAGGKPEEFDAATKAYDVLSDEVKRARYDQTGATEEPEDRITPQAINMLVAVLGAVMEEPDILRRNPIPFFKESLSDMKADAIKAGATARQKADHLIKVRDRFKRKNQDGTDVIGGFIGQAIEKYLMRKTAMDEQTIVADAALKMLDDYTYEPEKGAAGAPSKSTNAAILEAMRSGKLNIDDILNGKY